MTTSNEHWQRKIQAFLYTPPDKALSPDGAEDRTKELIAAALNLDKNSVTVPDDIKQADQIAAGLDIPPIVQPLPGDVFLNNPVLVHPLSGLRYKGDASDDPVDLKKLQSLTPNDLGTINQIIRDAVMQIRTEIEQTQHGQLPQDPLPKRLFLALWRKLPETIRKKEEQITGPKLGPLWDLLPADPRTPSHSVWDHAAVASAIAGTGSDPALLIFDIASVQDFISVSRRTQDFWMGSFLISYLIWEAIKVVAEEYGPDSFVYPSLRELPLVDLWLLEKQINVPRPSTESLQISNFPERFTAIVPSKEAKRLAEEARAALLKKWREIACAVKHAVEKAANLGAGIQLAGDPNWERSWGRQIDGAFSRMILFWVVCPWGDDRQAVMGAYDQLTRSHAAAKARRRYEDFRQIIEVVKESNPDSLNIGMMYMLLSTMAARSLSARKNLRDFHQVEEPEYKCTLCGLRQILHPGYDRLREWAKTRSSEVTDLSDYGLLRYFWQALGQVRGEDPSVQKLAGRIRRGDRLCAVCLTKRLALEAYFEDNLGFDHHLFPSTATMATAPFKADIIMCLIKNESPRLLEYVEHYVNEVRKFLKKHEIWYTSTAVPKLHALKKQLPPEIQQTIETFLRLDGDWLYEESFDPAKISREYHVEEAKLRDDPQREEALAALRSLLRATDDLKIRRPSRYFAVVAMDGDKMSDWVAGFRAPSFLLMFHPDVQDRVDSALRFCTRPLGAAIHLAMSTALKNFAIDLARWVVEEQHLGKLIYAGGDDVLAFVPIRDLLPVMRKLRRLFQGHRFPLPEDEAQDADMPTTTVITGKGFARITPKDRPDRCLMLAGVPPDHIDGKEIGLKFESLTASVGAAIVHESHPLTQAIEEAFARAMKEHAKDRLDRDAFAVHLIKRAGGPLEVGMKWNLKEGKQNVDVLERVNVLIDLIRKEKLSTRLAYDLEEKRQGLAGSLEDLQEHPQPWWHEAQIKELRRLMKRHLHLPKEEREQQEAILRQSQQLLEAIQGHLVTFVQELRDRGETPLSEMKESWETLTNLLLLARFLAEEG
ncbi:MAG: type III-B CRISPR-associated protein Cas10/Cmr2 [Candidatus Methanomethylicaceae archaeon]